MEEFDIIVVGAGAAGLMAAGRAAELGARVMLLEHKSHPGRKLAITGKGRCNLTNSLEKSEFLKHFHPNGRFLRNSFSRFFSEHLIEFINSLGVKTVEERGGRVFPKSGRARDIVEALVGWVRYNKVELRTNTTVGEFIVVDNAVKGIVTYPVKHRKHKIIPDKTSTQSVFCKTLVLATGGASYPATGSTGDGYRLAKDVGHEIITPRPALVPLEVDFHQVEGLEGLGLKNIEVSLWAEEKKIASAFGEMTFTQTGLSGPVVLSLSHQVVDLILSKSKVRLTLDLKPALDHKRLDDRLLRDLEKNRLKSFQKVLKELLPMQLIPYCSQRLQITLDKRANEISAKERKSLRMWLKEMPFEITGYRPFNEAIITSGGIKLQEIDPKTMASKIVNRLFFAGEVLDIQANTGGYNLQAAFSTGYLAAESAVSALSEF